MAAAPSRQPYEDLRENAGDATVFLANLGPIVGAHRPGQFATNLFAAGGVVR